MPKGGKGANTAPILDDADVLIDHLGAFSYQAVAFDPDAQEKLTYSFLVDGKQRQTFTADNGVVFTIDKNTGLVGSTALIPYDHDALYSLTVAVEDRFHALDLGIVRLAFPPCTEFSIDNDRTVGDGPQLINAGTDAFCFTTDTRSNTFVGIANFTNNDRIVISGVSSVDDLRFFIPLGSTDDLIITYHSDATGTNEIISLGNIILDTGIAITDYASVVAAVGFDFLTIDPCVPVSIDVGTEAGPPVVFDASDASYCFTDDANVTTDVVITGFGRNDRIDVSHATEATYSFTTGVGPDASDLIITYNISPVAITSIVLDNVITNPGVVFNYATAVAAVGFDFMTFDTCVPVSIDVGTVFDPEVFDASLDAYCFTDSSSVASEVVITGFGNNDLIEVSGATQSDYNFARSFDDIQDLVITYADTSSGAFNHIVLDNVLGLTGAVNTYATAVAAVGFDFMTFG